MNTEQIKLANEITEILKDTSLSTEERLNKMKLKLNEKKTIDEKAKSENTPPPALETYNSSAIKKAALRNQLLNKNKEI